MAIKDMRKGMLLCAVYNLSVLSIYGQNLVNYMKFPSAKIIVLIVSTFLIDVLKRYYYSHTDCSKNRVNSCKLCTMDGHEKMIIKIKLLMLFICA